MILLLLACGASDPAPAVPASSTVGSVAYTYAWAEPGERVQRHAGAWVFETDGGYRVELEEGVLVAYSSWLTPCAKRQLGGALVLPWLISTARAGHSIMSNPTASRTPFVETLGDVEPRTVQASFEPVVPCRIDTLVARGDKHTAPEDHTMKGTSLRLRGRWSRGDGPPRAFSIDTPIAHSGGVDLAAHDGGGSHLEVRITRTLDGLFDGIELENEPDARIARAVLANLLANAEIVATRRPNPRP